MPDIVITPNRGTTSNPKIDFTGVTAGTIKLEVLADGTIAWNGANGSLFSIADSLSGSLMSVNDISGLPAFEVFSDNRVVVGQFGANLLLGKTTNSSNGRLQLTSHTTSAGGIGFGTDTSFYRSASGVLNNEVVSGSLAYYLRVGGSIKSFFQFTGSQTQIGDTANSLAFISNNITVLTISSTGNVGIGTTAPQQPLHVNAPTNYQGFLLNGNSAPSVGFVRSSNTTPEWKVGVSGSMSTSFSISKGASNDDKLIVDTDGKVGIGTTDPKYQLHVSSPNTASYFPLTLSSGVIGTSGNTVGIRFGYIGDQYQKGAIIYEGLDGFGIGKMHFAMNAASSTANAVLADSKFTILSTGNIGIGITSPASKLHISGSSGTIISITDNTLYSNSITNANAVMTYTVDTGNAAAGSAAHIFKRYATELVRIDQNGNVGIGTSTPNAKLNIAGAGGGGLNLLSLQPSDSTSAANQIVWSRSDNWTPASIGQVYSSGVNYGGNLVFSTHADDGVAGNQSSPIERMRILANGNVGIGTTAPAYKLHVSGTGYISGALTSGGRIAATGATCELYLDSGASNSTITSYGSGVYKDLWIRTLSSSSDGVWIKADTGRVGVGVAAPSEKLEVNGNILSGNSVANNSISVTRTGANSSSLAIQAFTDSPAINWNGAGGYFRFIYGATEQMRLDSTGNVGIGTTSPSPYKLSVDQGAVVQYPINLVSSGKFVRIGALNASYAHVDTDAASGFYFYDQVETGSGNSRLGLSNQTTYFALNGGNVGIGTTTPVSKFTVKQSGSGWTNGLALERPASTNAFLITYDQDSRVFMGINYSAILGIHSTGGISVGLNYAGTAPATNGMIVEGNVGIGTSAPSVLFQVSSAASGNFKLDSNGSGGHYYQAESNARLGFGRDLVTSAGHISFTMGGGSVATLGSAITMPANSQLGFYTSNGTSLVERMRLDGSGNVGIGTTNPAYKLEVSGSVADSIGNIRILPQNSRSAAYTTVLSDSGKHILHPSADTTARTFTIDSNTNVAYPIGTAITFINQNGAGVVTIAITSDTMRLAGAGTNGSRTLAANGVATAVKITSTEWIISGTGLT